MFTFTQTQFRVTASTSLQMVFAAHKRTQSGPVSYFFRGAEVHHDKTAEEVSNYETLVYLSKKI